MRLLVILLSTISCSMAVATTNLTGSVDRDAYRVYLNLNSKCSKYLIETTTVDASQNLKKLNTGDTLTGTGILDHENCIAAVSNIDYVGLKKMLGYWYSNDGIINVKDFECMSYYQINLKGYQNAPEYTVANPINYRYSVTPSDGREWVLFLSDATSTSFATIQFSKATATMKIYDSESGKINKVLKLKKWNNL